MKAARFERFGGPEVLQVADVPEPEPGAGQVRIVVRAAGVSLSDWKKRRGLMDQELPQTLGYEAAGIVDAIGADVDDTAVGDRVFGFDNSGAAQAEKAVLDFFVPVPESLGFAEAAALPAAVETAARALDQLGVKAGTTVLINGASGSVGSAAVQLAVARGARVVGTAGPSNQDYLRELGAEPVVYGDGLRDRLATPIDLALDVAGNGILPELAAIAGGAGNVLTVADVAGAQEHGVRFSRGDSGRALYAVAEVAGLIGEKRFRTPYVRTFALTDIAEAHRSSESGKAGGKIVLIP